MPRMLEMPSHGLDPALIVTELCFAAPRVSSGTAAPKPIDGTFRP